jgi:hypothetical protein
MTGTPIGIGVKMSTEHEYSVRAKEFPCLPPVDFELKQAKLVVENQYGWLVSG